MVDRKARLESLLHREIATSVAGLTDPRLGMITITRVEMTGDLHQITAYWTVLGDAKKRNLATHALESARGFIQRSYAPVVKTRLLPTLSFRYDEVEVRRNQMDDVIRRARLTDTDRGSRPEPAAPDPSKAESDEIEARRSQLEAVLRKARQADADPPTDQTGG